MPLNESILKYSNISDIANWSTHPECDHLVTVLLLGILVHVTLKISAECNDFSLEHLLARLS